MVVSTITLHFIERWTVERDRKVATKSEVSYIDIKANRHKSNVDVRVCVCGQNYHFLSSTDCKMQVRRTYTLLILAQWCNSLKEFSGTVNSMYLYVHYGQFKLGTEWIEQKISPVTELIEFFFRLVFFEHMKNPKKVSMLRPY